MSGSADHKFRHWDRNYPQSLKERMRNADFRCELVNMVDEVTKKELAAIPLLKTKAGPRDGELWVQRLKEEYQALIQVRHLSFS